MKLITWKNPWIKLVQINFSNDWKREMMASNLAAKVLNQKLLICGVKPKPRRQTQLCKRVSLWNSHFLLNRIISKNQDIEEEEEEEVNNKLKSYKTNFFFSLFFFFFSCSFSLFLFSINEEMAVIYIGTRSWDIWDEIFVDFGFGPLGMRHVAVLKNDIIIMLGSADNLIYSSYGRGDVAFGSVYVTVHNATQKKP